MEIYTEKEHARHLIKVLEYIDTCNECVATFGYRNNPAIYGFTLRTKFRGLWDNPTEVCKICTQFVGYNVDTRPVNIGSWCPCHQLGAEEALKKSWIALEKKGYLDIKDNCDRCGEKYTVAFSWFNSQNICQKCFDKEDKILVRLSGNGQDIWDYESCGYIPKMDGSNWIEKDKP